MTTTRARAATRRESSTVRVRTTPLRAYGCNHVVFPGQRIRKISGTWLCPACAVEQLRLFAASLPVIPRPREPAGPIPNPAYKARDTGGG